MTTAADHADAYAMLAEEGAAVTFSTGTPGTHDPETGLFTSPTTASVTGVAIRVRANRTEEDAYRAAGLSVDRVVTLLFAPTTYGSLPTLGSTVTWASETLTAKGITSLAPSGTAVIARVWCVR